MEMIPNLGKRITPTRRRFLACVIEREGAVLVRQRPPGVVNAHLWEFPNTEVPSTLGPGQSQHVLEAELGCALETFSPLTTVKHTITRYRITLEAFRAALNGRAKATAGRWVAINELGGLPFTSAHRRVLEAARPDTGTR